MKAIRITLQALLLKALGLTAASAQKVQVGYDKSTDVSKFTTYTWAEPGMPPQYPILFETVVSRVDEELRLKGFRRTSPNGDLTLSPSGGVEFGFAGAASTPILPTYGGFPPAFNATMWTGTTFSTAGTYDTEPTLVLTFVNRATNTVVWAGSVTQKLDIDRKNKSLEFADKAVIELLKEFPQKKR